MSGRDLTGLEKIGIVFGIAVPMIFVVWGGAIAWQLIAEGVAEREDLYGRIHDIELAQNEDSLYNDIVLQIQKEVEWLKFHHHDKQGGRGHVD